jgi:peptidoglycan hydrolase CwlO-like protein
MNYSRKYFWGKMNWQNKYPENDRKILRRRLLKKTLGTEIKHLIYEKLETDIKITQTKVDTTDLKIRQLGSEIAYKENQISGRVAALKEALLAIYESDEQSLPEVALSNESFSGLWNDLETLDQFSEGVSENIEYVRTLKGELEDKDKRQKAEKRKLLGLKDDLKDQKTITENVKKQKSELFVQT